MTRSKPIKNVPASVHHRLLNLARSRGTELNLLLQSYTAERFLYRVGQSPMSDRFTLKGASLFVVWGGVAFRGTRDVDLLRRGFLAQEELRADLETICAVSCPEDGVVFERGAENLRLRRLPVGRTQGAVRARMNANLGKIRLSLQVDVGFGDLPVPDRERCSYPVLLDQPEPSIWIYRRESSVAEKFHAMVQHGRDNTRMKDYWDIAVLAAHFSFHGPTLREAIQHTFGVRNVTPDDDVPALEASFFARDKQQGLWARFMRNTLLHADAQMGLHDVGDRVREFLGPVHMSVVRGDSFERLWPPGGPWRPIGSENGRANGG